MLAKNLDSQIHELRELHRMADELTAAIDTIQDAIKAEMTAAGVDVLTGSDWKAVRKPVTTSRIDTSALKKALPDLAVQFTKVSTARRFSVA